LADNIRTAREQASRPDRLGGQRLRWAWTGHTFYPRCPYTGQLVKISRPHRGAARAAARH